MLAAVREGDAQKLAELMKLDPGFEVNKVQSGVGDTLLHYACHEDHRSAVIPLLLAHPDVDANAKNNHGRTPFYYACSQPRTSCVREMLKDSRVNLNEPNDYGWTPLGWSAHEGYIDVIKAWIASGRQLYLREPWYMYKMSAIREAKYHADRPNVVTLLESFRSDPAQTRHSVRVELGLVDELAAEMFAAVVFASDGLLQIKDTTTPAARFFSIAVQLPLELQMVLCYGVIGSSKEIIRGEFSDPAFKDLANKL